MIRDRQTISNIFIRCMGVNETSHVYDKSCRSHYVSGVERVVEKEGKEERETHLRLGVRGTSVSPAGTASLTDFAK